MTSENYTHASKRRKKIRQRIIPAYRFKQQSSGDGVIQDYVNDILRVVEDDMKQSIEDEKTCSKTELAIYFDVPGMNNSRAKLHIYFHILAALKKAGYTPRLEILRLNIDKEIVFLHVTWLSKEDTSYEEYMVQFVKAHSIKKKSEDSEDSENLTKPISRRRRGKRVIL
jgi:hypothetical protein